jgi:hypothetical protein
MSEKVGKPLIFPDKESLQDAIDKYFKYCKDNKKKVLTKEGDVIELDNPLIPCIAGLAYFLKVDRQTIYNYSARDEYFDIIKGARDYIFYCLENKLCNAEGNQGGTIFIAKNYGYEDKRDLTIERKNYSPEVKEQIKKLEDGLQ